MKQRIVAIVSILSGLAVMALVVSIQLDPLAWTRASHPPAHPELAAAKTEPAAPPRSMTSEAPKLVELPAVRISSPAPATKTVKKREEREERAPEPCSEWRELGPRYVEDGKAQGAQRVRDLC